MRTGPQTHGPSTRQTNARRADPLCHPYLKVIEYMCPLKKNIFTMFKPFALYRQMHNLVSMLDEYF